MEIDKLIESINNLSNPSYFDWLGLIATIFISIIIMIFTIHSVNENTKKQIDNQNKEAYKPWLKLIGCEKTSIENIKYSFSTNSAKSGEDTLSGEDTFPNAYITITLKNIGNGLAHNISFYNLTTGEYCRRTQSIEQNIPQKYPSTEEIEKGGELKIPFYISYKPSQGESFLDIDLCQIICNYKDLNNNNYKLLFGCFFKKPDESYFIENHEDEQEYILDYNYYQQETKGYIDQVKKNSKTYQKILNDIKAGNPN